MVKESFIRSWLKKKKSQRHAHYLKDTRLITSNNHDYSTRTKFKCELCYNPGSLLACSICLKVIHLRCINLRPLDLPNSEWPCSECRNKYNEKFINECESFIQIQISKKEKILRKLKGSVRRTKKSKKLKKFERQYPNLVKNGQILYPIDDSLIWDKVKLHQVQYIEFPIESIPVQPNDLYSDLIQVCDFMYNFKDIIAGPSLTCDTLYEALDLTTETSLCKSVHISLSKLLIQTMIRSDSFRKKGVVLNYIVFKARKIVSLEKLIDFSYLTFFENLFTTEAFKELIEEIDTESWNYFQNFSFVSDYYTLPARYKLKLLTLFISLLLETRMFNEECNKRVEIQGKLAKDLSECNSLYKQKKNQAVDKENLELKIAIIKNDLKKVVVRSLPLGFDRHSREYYLFSWDPSKIMIKSYNSQNREHAAWTYLKTRTEVESLISALNEKGTKEYNLIQELNELLKSSEFLGNFSSVSSIVMPVVHNELTLRNWITDLHVQISDNLGISPSAAYISSLVDCDFPTLVTLIINFHQAFTFKSNNAGLGFKQTLGLWDYSDLFGVWESSMKECRNYCEVFLCVHLLDNLVKKFVCEYKVPEINESAYSIARKSYKEERLSKVKKDSNKEQDTHCFLCNEPGLVICCERCPKVAHLRCAKLKKLPKGEWLCSSCSHQVNNIKLNRSQQIKY